MGRKALLAFVAVLALTGATAADCRADPPHPGRGVREFPSASPHK